MLLLFDGKPLLLGFGLRLGHIGSSLRCVRALAVDGCPLRGRHWRRTVCFGAGDALILLSCCMAAASSCCRCRSSASCRACCCCCDSKVDTCCAFGVVGLMVKEFWGAERLLPLSKLEMLAMPIKATMTTSAITTGRLLRRGGFASGCSGTVAGAFSFWSAMATSPPRFDESPRAACRWRDSRRQ